MREIVLSTRVEKKLHTKLKRQAKKHKVTLSQFMYQLAEAAAARSGK